MWTVLLQVRMMCSVRHRRPRQVHLVRRFINEVALAKKSHRTVLFYCGGLTIITAPLFRLTEAWFIYENFQASTHRITLGPSISVGHTCCLGVNRPINTYRACYSTLPHNPFRVLFDISDFQKPQV